MSLLPALLVLAILFAFWNRARVDAQRLAESTDPDLRRFGDTFSQAVAVSILVIGLYVVGKAVVAYGGFDLPFD